ncbi:MAG: ribokinase [Treponema sp.]
MKILVVGSMNMDFRINVLHLVNKGETELSDKLDLIPGGKGANQAFAAGRLGIQTIMLGARGDDTYGKVLEESLNSAGVETGRLAVRSGISTGIAIVEVDKTGNNSIIVIPGANATVDSTYIDKNTDILRQCDIVLLQMEIPPETVLHTAKLAKKLGKTVILDPAPVPPVMPENIYSYVDYIKPNETELQMLTGEKDLEKGMHKLISSGVKCVIVTTGKNGALVLERGSSTVMEYPAPDVPVVDTTAAGDSFSAAFSVALSEGKNVGEAVKFANIVGAVVVSRKGAQTSIPDRKYVKEFVKTLNAEFL